MYEVYCLNLLTNERFTKSFDNIKDQKKFMCKCRYSTKIMVIGCSYFTTEEGKYLGQI